MSLKFARFAVVAASLAALAPAARADGDLPADRGKRRVAVLFAPTIETAAPLVARVRAGKPDDERNVALATVVRTDGYLLTKGSELEEPLSVVLADGTEYPAKKVAYHKPSDLALLKIDAKNLRAAEFASDSAAEVGNWVATPGPIAGSLPVGVVSVAARKLYRDQAVIENGNKGVLGISFGEGKDTTVYKVQAGAKKAGILGGDVIREVGGQPVQDREDLLSLLDNYRPNQKVEVVVDRGDETVTVEVELSGRDDRGTRQNTMGGSLSGRRTGFPKVIQHDTVLRPRDCGGPLVDLDGRVLGINIARAGRVETWTLPSSVIQPVLKEMLDGKYAVKARAAKVAGVK